MKLQVLTLIVALGLLMPESLSITPQWYCIGDSCINPWYCPQEFLLGSPYVWHVCCWDYQGDCYICDSYLNYNWRCLIQFNIRDGSLNYYGQ